MKIIVAEDDKMLAEMICGILREGGHIAVPAYDSVQVMFAATNQPPDLVLLDINMPGGTGVEVLRKLKMLKKTKEVPIIVISGNTDPDMPAQVVAMGAHAYIPKPIDPELLLREVARSAL